jgi:hypothetical protein
MKFKMSLPVTVILSVFIALPVLAELKLEDRAPGEVASHTLKKRFSPENSLDCIKKINKALESFRILTEKSKDTLSSEEISVIGNMGWEIQHLGFHNWVAAVEGTLRKQDYQIKRVEFQLAEEKYKAGKIEKKEVEEKEVNRKKAERDFQTFWDSFCIAD